MHCFLLCPNLRDKAADFLLNLPGLCRGFLCGQKDFGDSLLIEGCGALLIVFKAAPGIRQRFCRIKMRGKARHQ